VTNAISPARVQRVSVVDETERVVEAVVEDRQLSLAIGKKGQNVRLAAKLTGWKIDITSEEEKRREVEAQFDGLGTEPAPLSVPGLDEGMVEKLNAAGIETVERMVSATATELSEVLGISEGSAEALRQGAEAATMAAGGAVGSGTSEAAHQDGIEPIPAAPLPDPAAAVELPAEAPPDEHDETPSAHAAADEDDAAAEQSAAVDGDGGEATRPTDENGSAPEDEEGPRS
jgi:N utilization substance protein A